MRVLVVLVRKSAEAELIEREVEVEQIPARGEFVGFDDLTGWFQVTSVRRAFSETDRVATTTSVHAVQI